MSSADINKILLAIFSALLTVLLIHNVINVIVHPEPHGEPAHSVAMSGKTEKAAGEAEKPAAEAQKPEAAAEAQAALEPVTALLAAADAAAGAKLSKKCATCHTFTEGGGNRVGPNLWGVVGRDKGSVADFSYSSGMRDKGGAWTYDELNAFLANPKEFVSGTKMVFPGLKDAKDRANIIAFLRQQAATPAPLLGQ